MVNVRNSLKIVCLFLLVFSCKNFQSENTPDISQISVDVVVNRFDQDLFELDTTNFGSSIDKLAQKYPDFFPFFTKGLMDWPIEDSIAFKESVVDFIHQSDIRSVYNSVQEVYPNIQTIEEELVTAFKYFKFHFPNQPIPQINTFVSTFRQMALTLDTVAIGVGLDMHLGKDYALYPSTGFPQYIIQEFTPEHLAIHIMQVYGQEQLPPKLPIGRFIDEIVHNGKLLYFLDQVLPHTPDHLKIAYTPDQLTWCENSEVKIWEFFIEKSLLFESESKKYEPYTQKAPSTMGMPSKSPGNVGSWLGWQIVKQFMEKNPEIGLQELMKMQDGRKILDRSKYKPS